MALKSSPAKRPAATSKAGPSGNKGLKMSVLTALRVVALFGKLKRVKGTSSDLQRDIARRQVQLVKGGKLRVGPSDAAASIAEAARLVENELQATFTAADAKIKRVDDDKQALAAAQAAAETDLTKSRQAKVESKAELRMAENTIKANRKRIKLEMAAYKDVDLQARALESKKKQLQNIAEEVYAPLKEMAASGSDGRKRVSALRKLGKEYGFNKDMLSVMPQVLKKKVDKRQEFDLVVLKSLDDELAKHIDSLRAQLVSVEASLEEHDSALQQAREALDRAEEAKKKGTQKARQAQGMVAKSKKLLVEARRRTRRFPAEVLRTLRELTFARVRLDKFRAWTLATLQRCLAADLPDSEGHEVDGKPSSHQ